MYWNIHYKTGCLQVTRKTQERFHLKGDKIINLLLRHFLRLMKGKPRRPTIGCECLPPQHEYVLAAREEARNKHFPRGELWCLVKLFWLELGHFHPYRALITFIQALGTWRNGELRRNEGFKLFGHYLLQVLSTPIKLLKRTPHTVMGAGTLNAKLNTCICPEHQ